MLRLQDNYNRMLQEQKPKKAVRKKPKISAMTRPPKRNKRKKKSTPSPPSPQPKPNPTPASLPIPVPHKQPIQHAQIQPIPSSMDLYHHDTVMHDESVELMSKIPPSICMTNQYLNDNAAIYQFAQTGLNNLTQQELFTVCENSSAYESSEDTGVGGLSESELMGASDGIGKFDITPQTRERFKSSVCLFQKFRSAMPDYWKNMI